MSKDENKVENLRKMVRDLDSKIEILQKQKELYSLKIEKLEKKISSKGSGDEKEQ